MTQPLKLGLIGTGGISRRHAISMKDLHERGRDGFGVTAVCDVNEAAAQERADQFAELFGSRPTVYTDYKVLLAQEELDAVDICLPHGLHHGVTIDCLEAGRHVLCEKPLGITIKACRLMAEAAERTGLVLSTGVPHRCQPGQRAAHWVFNESGLMGDVRSFFHSYTRPPAAPANISAPVPERVRWRRNRLMSGGGPVLDSGFHYCDSMRYFFGGLDTVYARALNAGGSFEEAPEDTVFVTLTFKSGVTGSWTWSLAAPGAPARNVTFYGTQGSLRDTTQTPFAIFHLFERRLGEREDGELQTSDGKSYSMAELEQMHLDSLNEDQRERLFPGGADDGFSIEIWDFLEAVRGNRSGPEVDAWGGLYSLATGDAIYESITTGDVIKVDDIISGARSQYQDPIDAHWSIS